MIPRAEHPRPDWERAGWRNLNGDWKFAFDKSDAGVKEKWFIHWARSQSGRGCSGNGISAAAQSPITTTASIVNFFMSSPSNTITGKLGRIIPH